MRKYSQIIFKLLNPIFRVPMCSEYRTLTPFGFQSEERSYWDSPETYNTMSPFMNADKMKTPLLLIHGEADNNSGTYPLQSERYFNALKGLGATARLAMLPKESHGYSAKESLGFKDSTQQSVIII